jgi:hypothetical protein
MGLLSAESADLTIHGSPILAFEATNENPALTSTMMIGQKNPEWRFKQKVRRGMPRTNGKLMRQMTSIGEGSDLRELFAVSLSSRVHLSDFCWKK